MGTIAIVLIVELIV